MQDKEFIEITNKIVNNRKFNKLKDEEHHHVTTRLEHNLNVAYETYKITKFLKLDYINITKAALMHDFYFNKDFKKHRKGVINHPFVSLINASKLTSLNDIQKNIILSHMFPFGKTIPKYKESIIVDLVDDVVSVKEIILDNAKYFKTAITFIMIIILNYIK